MIRFQSGDSYGGEGLHYLPPSGKYEKLVIFMHGLGDSASGFEDVWERFLRQIPELQEKAKIVLPTAPMAPVTLNGGSMTSSWFDLKSLTPGNAEDFETLRVSGERIFDMIKEETIISMKIRTTKDILIGGFSQGGCMTYFVGLQYPLKFAGLMPLSGWIPGPEKLEVSAAAKDNVILHCHGSYDPIVRKDWFTSSVKEFDGCQGDEGKAEEGDVWGLGSKATKAGGVKPSKLLKNLQLLTYPMPHSVVDEEIEACQAFIQTRLFPSNKGDERKGKEGEGKEGKKGDTDKGDTEKGESNPTGNDEF